MMNLFHKYASLKNFYSLSLTLSWWLTLPFVIILGYAVIGALWLAPQDYQQGESFRIMYVHVPSAWLSLFIYMNMVGASVFALIWRVKLSEIVLRACAPLGAIFTFLALVTGSIWGKPMWGTWWVWDARLTSELVLLFIYFGIIALFRAIEDRRMAARSCALLTLVGAVNVPIIHYSVEWWSTLHQGPTISKIGTPSIHIDMLIPLIAMSLAFTLYFMIACLARIRIGIIEYDRNSNWVKDLVKSTLQRDND
jgi:heme exporter protein C